MTFLDQLGELLVNPAALRYALKIGERGHDYPQ
jgi:hypothetical protein